jgi:hypothetical protein
LFSEFSKCWSLARFGEPSSTSRALLLSKEVAGPILDGTMQENAVFNQLSRSNEPRLNSQDDNARLISSLMH